MSTVSSRFLVASALMLGAATAPHLVNAQQSSLMIDKDGRLIGMNGHLLGDHYYSMLKEFAPPGKQIEASVKSEAIACIRQAVPEAAEILDAPGVKPPSVWNINGFSNGIEVRTGEGVPFRNAAIVAQVNDNGTTAISREVSQQGADGVLVRRWTSVLTGLDNPNGSITMGISTQRDGEFSNTIAETEVTTEHGEITGTTKKVGDISSEEVIAAGRTVTQLARPCLIEPGL